MSAVRGKKLKATAEFFTQCKGATDRIAQVCGMRRIHRPKGSESLIVAIERL